MSMGNVRDVLVPVGEYLQSDVTLLREALNNIKGKLYCVLESPTLGDVEKEKLVEILREVYGECDRVLWSA